MPVGDSNTKINEVQKYLTITNHQYNPQTVIISRKTWDALSNDEKKIFTDAAVESAAYQRKVSREAAVTALEQVRKGGMPVTEITGPELVKFRDKMQPVIEKHAALVGPEVVAALQAELAKIRK